VLAWPGWAGALRCFSWRVILTATAQQELMEVRRDLAAYGAVRNQWRWRWPKGSVPLGVDWVHGVPHCRPGGGSCDKPSGQRFTSRGGPMAASGSVRLGAARPLPWIQPSALAKPHQLAALGRSATDSRSRSHR